MKEQKGKQKEIDGNAIVSPKNTRKLYGGKSLDPREAPEASLDEPSITLPDGTDENMFPSAP